MDISRLNSSYENAKSKYETLTADKNKVNELKALIKEAKKVYFDMVDDNEIANLRGQKQPYDKKALEDAKRRVDDKIQELMDFKADKEEALEQINRVFERLETLPEMKDYLDKKLARRMKKGLKDLEKQLKEQKKVQKIINENPNIAKTIKSMTKLKAEVKKLEKTIKKLEANPARTSQQEDRLQQSKADLAKKNSLIDTRKAEITKFVEKKYKESSDKEKQETTKMLCDLETADIDKEISVTKRNIQKRQKAYEELTGNKYEISTENNEISIEDNSEGEKQEEAEHASVPAPVSRWQRFKNWIKQKIGRNKEKDEKAEPTPKEKEEPAEEKKLDEEKGKAEKSKDFWEKYKAVPAEDRNVVEAYLNKKERDMLRDDDDNRNEDR